MAEWRLFPEGTIPECTTAEWYLTRARAPHLEEPGHRERLLKTAEVVLDARPQTVVDLGCGDGGLLSLLRGMPAWGYDLSPVAVQAARGLRGADAQVLDVVSCPGQVQWAGLAVCTEMFEHLVDPHGFAREIAKHSTRLVASSPVHETDRNHYEFHTWAWDMAGYRALVEQAGFTVTWHEIVGGAQILAAKK